MYSQGYTLIELLCVFCIHALLFSLILQTDSFYPLRAHLETTLLQQYLQTARLSTLLTRQSTYLCPGFNLQTCASNWQRSIKIRKINHGVHNTLHEPLIFHSGHVHFNHGHTLFLSHNITKHQTNGTFEYISNQGNLNKKIIINVLGRIRVN